MARIFKEIAASQRKSGQGDAFISVFLTNQKGMKFMDKMEKVYKTMESAGIIGIVVGSIVIAVGVTCGTLSIIGGSLLLKRKKHITF